MSDAVNLARQCAQKLVLGSGLFIASTAALGASTTSSAFGITGTDVLGITGTDVLGITGTDVLGITGTDVLGITGTDVFGITGTDVMGITGTDLLAVGIATAIDTNVLSVLGQTVWIGPGLAAQDFIGKPVAVFGQIDFDSGSFVNTSVVALGGADLAGTYPSYLRGMVDSVDLKLGIAVVSGISVDYTALLANGIAPSVGSEVAVSGYAYGGQTTLVADPSVKFNLGL